jgi:hypothetical protein
MIAVGCGPIPGIRERIPDSEVSETARILAIVESAHSELLDVVKELFGMVNEDRTLSSQLDELRAERARLQAELGREVARGIGVQGGGEDAADDEIDSGVLATFILLRRIAVHMRKIAEASLEEAPEGLCRANDVTASLRAQLHAAEAHLQVQAVQWEEGIRGSGFPRDTTFVSGTGGAAQETFGSVAAESEGRPRYDVFPRSAQV